MLWFYSHRWACAVFYSYSYLMSHYIATLRNLQKQNTFHWDKFFNRSSQKVKSLISKAISRKCLTTTTKNLEAGTSLKDLSTYLLQQGCPIVIALKNLTDKEMRCKDWKRIIHHDNQLQSAPHLHVWPLLPHQRWPETACKWYTWTVF